MSSLREAIIAIHSRGEHPSPQRIAKELNRENYSLSGSECKIRRQVFAELGIELRAGPYSKQGAKDG